MADTRVEEKPKRKARASFWASVYHSGLLLSRIFSNSTLEPIVSSQSNVCQSIRLTCYFASSAFSVSAIKFPYGSRRVYTAVIRMVTVKQHVLYWTVIICTAWTNDKILHYVGDDVGYVCWKPLVAYVSIVLVVMSFAVLPGKATV